MPRTPIDFSKTIIYKIVHKEDPDNHEIYVGHTTDFTNRKRCHKRGCENPNNNKHHFKVYKYIRENGGWDKFIMLEIEKYPCNDGNEARARENYWYNELKSKLNSCFPSRTQKQYQQDNRDKYLEYQKQYKQDNREKILEWKKQYDQDNREKISEKNKQKITCDICGSIVRKSDISKHKKTKKCMEAKK
jgi:hypothetical protein